MTAQPSPALAHALATVVAVDPSQRPDYDPDAPDTPETRAAYRARAAAIYDALAAAIRAGISAGIGWDEDPAPAVVAQLGPGPHPIAYVELPTGQVSWHLRPHPYPWDGAAGTTASRIAAYIATVEAS